jgi:hypothetical protein
MPLVLFLKTLVAAIKRAFFRAEESPFDWSIAKNMARGIETIVNPWTCCKNQSNRDQVNFSQASHPLVLR